MFQVDFKPKVENGGCSDNDKDTAAVLSYYIVLQIIPQGDKYRNVTGNLGFESSQLELDEDKLL